MNFFHLQNKPDNSLKEITHYIQVTEAAHAHRLTGHHKQSMVLSNFDLGVLTIRNLRCQGKLTQPDHGGVVPGPGNSELAVRLLAVDGGGGWTGCRTQMHLASLACRLDAQLLALSHSFKTPNS